MASVSTRALLTALNSPGQNQTEADEIWRKQLKNRVLGLKLAGKEDKAIVELLEKRFRNQVKRLTQLEGKTIYANPSPRWPT